MLMRKPPGAPGSARRGYETEPGAPTTTVVVRDEKNLAKGKAKFPGAKTYADWRKCLEQKDLDAVLCCTPDHHHALIALAGACITPGVLLLLIEWFDRD